MKIERIKIEDKRIDQVGNYQICTPDVDAQISRILKYKEFSFLRNLKYKAVFWLKPKNSKGQRLWASVAIASDLNRLLHGYQIVLQVDREAWATQPEKREVILYRELCRLHCGEDGALQLLGYDIEDFAQVYRRYGDWRSDVDLCQSAIIHYELGRQLTLAMPDGVASV